MNSMYKLKKKNTKKQNKTNKQTTTTKKEKNEHVPKLTQLYGGPQESPIIFVFNFVRHKASLYWLRKTF